MAEQLDFLDFKSQSALPKLPILSIAAALVDALLANLHSVAADLLAVVQSGTERTFINRLQQKISSNTGKLIERWKY